jgi:uncharacterized protein (UPF0332 family)
MKDKWNEISADASKAAKLLHANKHYRSALSRAYFAAYSAIVAVLCGYKGSRFDYDGNNPSHDKLRRMILSLNPRHYRKHNVTRLHRTINRMWAARIDADYGVRSTVDCNTSQQAISDMQSVLAELALGESK